MTAQPISSALDRLAAAESQIAKQEKRIAELEAFVAVLRAAVGGALSSGVGAIASATDLDGKYGNPKVRCNPTDWKGAPRKGHLLNRCEPEFLDLYSEMLEFFAQKADAAGEKASGGKPKSFYDRADAARARGWAKRLRDGWQPPQQAQATTGAARYGTSGWGASAKHSAPSERPSTREATYAQGGGEAEPNDFASAPDDDTDDQIPF